MSQRDRRLAGIEALYRREFSAFVRVARGIVGDRERATGFADGVGGAAKEELRPACAVVGAVEAELEGGGAAVDGEDGRHG